MNNTRLIPLVLAVLLTAAAVQAATVTISASKDNTIFQNAVNNTGGGAAGIFSGTDANLKTRRGLIAFDIAANVPAGAIITSAELTLTLARAGGGANQTIGLHRLSVDWGEGTAGSDWPGVGGDAAGNGGGGGFPAAPGDATWNANFLSSSLWSNPGATGNFNPVASGSSVIAPTIEAPYTWSSTPSLVNDLQSWLNAPATNYGWVLLNANETSTGTVRAFYSRSATIDGFDAPLNPAARPSLKITFAVVPEPAGVVMFVLAGPLLPMLRRR